MCLSMPAYKKNHADTEAGNLSEAFLHGIMTQSQRRGEWMATTSMKVSKLNEQIEIIVHSFKLGKFSGEMITAREYIY